MIGGAEDWVVESKSDLTDQEGWLSMVSRSASGAFDAEERARRANGLTLRLDNNR